MVKWQCRLPVLVGLAALAVAGCATGPAPGSTPEIAALPEPWAGRIAEVEQPPTADEIMALTPEMHSYLTTHVDGRRHRQAVVRSLTNLLLHPGLLGIDYDARRTGTAAETYRSRVGNCLSLSILFVAMARELGIDANFQQVEVVPQWDLHGRVLFATRHVNVYGRLPGYGEYVMDFYPYEDKPRGRHETLRDSEVIGQFYNNLGAGRLASGDYTGAWVYLLAAIREAPRRSDTWSNLGLLYQRVGVVSSAEAMLRYAIRLAPDNASAINNLAVLLHREGRESEAAEWLGRVQRVRERNPYYHFALARQAEATGDIREALEHLERAIHLKEEESLFVEKADELTERLAMIRAGTAPVHGRGGDYGDHRSADAPTRSSL